MEWPQPPLPGRLHIEREHPFVGRRSELETIEEAWASVEEGRRQVLFIGGEPGAGKTRLVAETAAALLQNEAAVFFGSSFADYAVPYQPFVEILETIFDHETGAPTGAIPDSARHLLRLTPRIADHRPDLRPDEREEGRRELFNAFTELIRALSELRPVTLVLEDLHWAKEPTRQLLSHLTQTTSEERLLIMATFRSTAPDRDALLTRMIGDLYRLPGVKRVDLAGLAVADIAELIGASGGMRTEDRMRDAVVLRDQTGGNPFFVCELIAHHASMRGDHPVTVIDALDYRLEGLSAVAVGAVELAAVLGADFDSDTLIAAADGEIEVLDGLDEAIQSGLIVRKHGTATQFQFTHSLTRQAVIQRMGSAHRAKTHAAVAEAIEMTWAPSGLRHAVLAHHFREANAFDRAAQEAVEAAKYAEETLAYEEAAFWYQRASESDYRHRNAWLLSAGQNLVHAGDFDTAKGIFRDLLDSTNPQLVVQAALGFEEASFYQGITEYEGATVIEQALERLDPDPHDAQYVLLLGRKARALSMIGDPRAPDVGARAIELALAIGDSRLIVDTRLSSITGSLMPENTRQLAQTIRQSFDWAVESGTRPDIMYAATVLAPLAYFEGDPENHRYVQERAATTSATTDFSFWKLVVAGIACSNEFIRGNLAEARTIATETRRKSRRSGLQIDEGPFGLQKFMIEREAGQLEPIRNIAETIDPASRIWEPGLIAMYIELDLLDRAEERLDVFFEEPPETRRDAGLWPAALALLADAIVALNSREKARTLRPELLRYSGLNLMTSAMVAVFGAADRYIAQLDALLGLPTAEDYFRSALELDVRMGATLHEVETLIAYAAFLERSSDHQQVALAAEYRQRARTWAERKGLVRQLRRLDASTTIRSDRPAGLTPREVEVLRLIAEGLSNNDIAERLFISQNTAANHVRSILIKTQAPNRTKAAIFAAEHGLLV